MRTRLDEIVEEEAKSGMWYIEDGPSFYLGETMRRIADRAFQHGVYRAAQEALEPGIYWTKPVQPTPAGEKHFPREGKHAPWCIDDAHLFGTCVCGRRRGQRRSGYEWKAYGRYTRHLRHDGVEWHTDSQADRRSGDDRRSRG